ncbi:MAG TPA: hypothetical protein VJR47_03195 [Stellaceae bacterium]|nr:hypothetical protein [Stellaceae bacterium]
MEQRFGPAAARIARDHADERHRRGRISSASIWSAVAGAVRLRCAAPGRPQTGIDKEPSLDEVMSGTVTRRVMAAHGVDPAELKKHLRDIWRRRAR